MNLVRDTEAVYLANPKTALAELIGEILGSAKAGRQIMDELIPSGEEASAQNIADRLRLTLDEANESTDRIPGATAKQTRRLKAAWNSTRGLYFTKLQEGKIVGDPSIAAEAFQSISWQPCRAVCSFIPRLQTSHPLLPNHFFWNADGNACAS